jgi:transcriptional regulator with XRE-family HTH domain
MITTGSLLKNRRLEKNLTLDQVEAMTKIRKKYLSAIEENNWKIFASSVYIAGVIKSYSRYLGVDDTKTLAYFRRDFVKQEAHSFNKKIESLELLPETKKIIIIALTSVFVLFLSYFIFQFYKYMVPPSLIIISPEKRVFRNLERISVTGKTDKQSVVTIYNEIIYPDKEGLFRYDFPLKKGKNILKIDIVGANGKQSQEIIEYILE